MLVPLPAEDETPDEEDRPEEDEVPDDDAFDEEVPAEDEVPEALDVTCLTVADVWAKVAPMPAAAAAESRPAGQLLTADRGAAEITQNGAPAPPLNPGDGPVKDR